MAKVLVVEDERIVARSIANRLQQLGHDVIAIVDSGEAAIQQAHATPPDLILMDIVLQGDINGIEAAERIQAALSVPVVYLTAYADDHTLDQAKGTETYGYILKPFREQIFDATVEMALKRAQTTAQARAKLAATQSLNAFQSRYLQLVSQQLYQPLLLMQTKLEQLQQPHLARLQQVEEWATLRTTTEQLNDWVEGILLLGRMEAGHYGYQPALLEVSAFCQSVLAELQPLTDRSLGFQHQGCLAMVSLDPQLLGLLLTHLLRYLLKLVPTEDLQLTAICEPGVEVSFAVRLLPETLTQVQHHLEQPRLQPMANLQLQVGVDLAIVQKCLDLQGGQLQLIKTPAAATQLRVSLPLKDDIRYAEGTP